jgi:hypothetical protein
MKKIINRVEKIDCGAIVNEKFWHHFWREQNHYLRLDPAASAS